MRVDSNEIKNISSLKEINLLCEELDDWIDTCEDMAVGWKILNDSLNATNERSFQPQTGRFIECIKKKFNPPNESSEIAHSVRENSYFIEIVNKQILEDETVYKLTRESALDSLSQLINEVRNTISSQKDMRLASEKVFEAQT